MKLRCLCRLVRHELLGNLFVSASRNNLKDKETGEEKKDEAGKYYFHATAVAVIRTNRPSRMKN